MFRSHHRSINQASCRWFHGENRDRMSPWAGLTGQLPRARMFQRTDVPSMEPSLPPVSCIYVRRLFSGRTIFLGPKTEQSLVHLIIFRLPHAKCRPTIFSSCRGEPNG
jgi:hypothetical protein